MHKIRSQTFPKERVVIIDFVTPLELAFKQAWYDCKKLGISSKRGKDLDKITSHYFLTNLLHAYNEIKTPYPKVFGVYPSNIKDGVQDKMIRLAKKSGYPICEIRKWGDPDMISAALKGLQKFDFNFSKIKKVIHRLGLKQFKQTMESKKLFATGSFEEPNLVSQPDKKTIQVVPSIKTVDI